MAGPGRNDLCPCGSGKKFKHCCLVRAQTATGITPQDRTAAIEAITKYMRRDEFDDFVTEAARRWTDMEGATIQQALEVIFEFDTSVEAFFEWLFFDLRTDDGRTLSEWFVDTRAWAAPPRAVDYMRLMRNTHWRLYQVRAVIAGSGLSVRDLWTRNDLFITERLGSTQLVKWDVLGARVRPHADGTHQIEGCIMAMPPYVAKPLLKRLRAEYRSFVTRFPDESLNGFFKFAAPHLHDAWLDSVALREPPTLTTSDGDPLTTSQLVFDVPKAGLALVRLLEQPDFEPGESGRAVWFDGTSKDRRLLGDVECDKGTLTLTTLSKARAARGRARLEEVLGPLELRREEHRDFAPDVIEQDEVPPEAIDVNAVPELQSWLADRDREWLDLSVPALDGRTPREAAQDRRLRRRLRALLIDIENREARMTAGQTGRDLTWMWKELGLRRP